MAKKRYGQVLVFFFLLCFLTVPCPAADPEPGGTLRIGLSTDPPDLNPFIQSGGASERVKSMVYDSLMVYDMKGEVQGALAESWQNPEDKVFIFKIRDNAFFHNGEPVTASR